LLVRISGDNKNYPWGSSHLIQDHFGIGSSGSSLAEVWFGTHPQGESQVLVSGQNLSELLGSRLSFLVKLLAADKPLSIQVHPNELQARAGFDRESAAGLALDDPTRNYRDTSHKPELLIALTPFKALCGFRPTSEILEIFLAFSETEPRFGELAAMVATDSSLEQILLELLHDTELANRFDSTVVSNEGDSLAESARSLASQLLSQYPGDTGAMVALLLNIVDLVPGQAIYLPAGNLHAYLSGLGLEVMASSDNVIRAGLTQKHIDKAELISITSFQVLSEPVITPKKLAEGLSEYEVAAQEFRVYKADISGANLLADLDLPGSALVVCVSGEVAVSTSLEEREVLHKAEVVYLSEAKKFSLSGSGSVFVILGS
jgi:mannose-6-phosphate isomerase